MKESDIIEALNEADFDDLVPLLEKEMEIAKEKKAKKAQRRRFFRRDQTSVQNLTR